jgi:thioredoxin 1
MKQVRLIIGTLLLCTIGLAEVPSKEISKDQILAEDPKWQENYDKYSLPPEQIRDLKDKLPNDLRIDLYLGLWCSDSRNNVPPFLKILDSAEIAVPIRYISVHRKPAPTIRFFADKDRVERVPTFIFYKKDKEIGRIVENPKKSLIEDMLEILSQ